MIKHPLSFLGGFLAGMAAMYYMDSRTGPYRRSLLRDKFMHAGHEAGHLAQTKARRAMDRVKGMAATHSLDGRTRRPPESDEQLHGRDGLEGMPASQAGAELRDREDAEVGWQ